VVGVADASPQLGTEQVWSEVYEAAWQRSRRPGRLILLLRPVVLLYNCCLWRPIVFVDSVFLLFGIRRGRERKLRVWV